MYANVVYTGSGNVRTSTFKTTFRISTYIRRALQHGLLHQLAHQCGRVPARNRNNILPYSLIQTVMYVEHLQKRKRKQEKEREKWMREE